MAATLTVPQTEVGRVATGSCLFRGLISTLLEHGNLWRHRLLGLFSQTLLCESPPCVRGGACAVLCRAVRDAHSHDHLISAVLRV